MSGNGITFEARKPGARDTFCTGTGIVTINLSEDDRQENRVAVFLRDALAKLAIELSQKHGYNTVTFREISYTAVVCRPNPAAAAAEAEEPDDNPVRYQRVACHDALGKHAWRCENCLRVALVKPGVEPLRVCICANEGGANVVNMPIGKYHHCAAAATAAADTAEEHLR